MSAIRRCSTFALLVLACVGVAQDVLSKESYVRPPRDIEDAVLAPWYKNRAITNLSPDNRHYIYMVRQGMPKLSDMARPYANLGGIQIDTVAGRSRSLSTRSATGLSVVELDTGVERAIQVPADALVSDAVWSPDGSKIAFFAHFPNRTDVYVADVATGRSQAMTKNAALPTLTSTIAWTADGKSIVTVMVPNGRSAPPAYKPVADTPRVQVADSSPTRLRTYMGLLQTPTDHDLLEYYATGQLALVGLDGKVSPVGKPAMIEAFDPMADGKFFRVTIMERPFSYLYPASMFGERELIIDATGAEKVQIRKRSLSQSAAPPPAAPTGGRGGGGQRPTGPAEKRGLTWMPDGSGMVYLITEGQGAQARDKVVLWKPPFGDKIVQTLYETGDRVSSVRFGPDVKTLFINHTVDGRTRLSVVKPGGQPVTLNENRSGDDPVDLLTKDGPKAGSVVRVSSDGRFAYLGGTKVPDDNLKDAPRPFIERVSLTDGKREPLWMSSADMYETASLLDDDFNRVLVSRQSPTMVPQTFLVAKGAAEKQLTKNVDYVPDLTQAKRETIIVTRNDGIKFRVHVTLPRYHVPYAKYPTFFWFYPSEFTDQAAYDRSKRSFNKNLFRQVSGSNKAIFLRAGYVLIEPDAPIMGPAERKNDSYVPQLRNNLIATIDALDKLGYIDRNRMGLGGHSYGAFSTANAMVHTPFFKAGIAGDGNYNRVLTPFGFQSDQRQIWEAREAYLAVSPILWADQMSGALLMYHGIDDQNMGTHPINSERMFAALEALGKPAALYMYPYEDHGQIAEETVLDQWARWVAWLDKWVKNAK